MQKWNFILLGWAISLGCLSHAQPRNVKKITVPIEQIATGQIIHRFHDTSPLSPSGRYFALFRIPFEDHYPEPGDWGEVVLIDRKTGDSTIIARTFGWEMQVGANVQWGKDDSQLFYNDVDTTTWEAVTVLYNPLTGAFRRLHGTMFMCTVDGSQLVGHNLRNSFYAQSGYGVIVPDAYRQRNIGPVGTDGIFVTDVATNETRCIATIADIYEKALPSLAVPNPQDYEYYCFKAMWNPQGTRIMTCLIMRPRDGGKRSVAVITLKPDGTDIRTAITIQQYAKGGHHMAWMPDGEHISMNLNVNDNKPALELVTFRYDGTALNEVFWPGSGHPSFHPQGLPLVVTDAYPLETSVTKGDGVVPIRLLNIATGQEWVIDEVETAKVEDSSFRLDAHPTWDRSGKYIIYNSFDGGVRSVKMADVQQLVP